VDRGFTLIELLVAMMIVAIAFFALRPSFLRSLQANRDRAALRRVVGVLISARTEAIARGRLVRVLIAPGEGALWAEVQSEPEVDKSTFQALPLMGRPRAVLPEYLAIADLMIGGERVGGQRESVIYYYPDGRTSGAALLLVGQAGGEFPLALSPTTGRVQIAD